MHIFTFLEMHMLELAIYPRLDGYRGIGFHAANGPHLDRDCLLPRWRQRPEREGK